MNLEKVEAKAAVSTVDVVSYLVDVGAKKKIVALVACKEIGVCKSCGNHSASHATAITEPAYKRSLTFPSLLIRPHDMVSHYRPLFKINLSIRELRLLLFFMLA